MEVNDTSITVKAKHTLLNYTEAIPQFLWQIEEFFLNGYLNRKWVFLKMRITYSIIVEHIILSLWKALED